MVPRGKIELPTPAFSGPRSTGELPRHRYNQRFYGISGTQESKNVRRKSAQKYTEGTGPLDRHFID
jgi:hypothetical protein